MVVAFSFSVVVGLPDLLLVCLVYYYVSCHSKYIVCLFMYGLFVYVCSIILVCLLNTSHYTSLLSFVPPDLLLVSFVVSYFHVFTFMCSLLCVFVASLLSVVVWSPGSANRFCYMMSSLLSF